MYSIHFGATSCSCSSDATGSQQERMTHCERVVRSCVAWICSILYSKGLNPLLLRARLQAYSLTIHRRELSIDLSGSNRNFLYAQNMQDNLTYCRK